MIVLCRHGATDGNLAGAFLSSGDPPLNALGRTQSERLRAALFAMKFGVAFASPMRRCVETLAIVAPDVPSSVREELREIGFGEWEGRTVEWLEIHDPDGVARRRSDPASFRPAGGESFLDVARRLHPFVEALRSRTAGDALVVAHRGTLGVLERLLRGLPTGSREVTPLELGEYRLLTE
ncbi:MAG TPA: histidine phosphatase family protein [Candidatus Tumulicola sp.]|nr:histidine phosphatase family protein [Candidatus Tumulicola sp.]